MSSALKSYLDGEKKEIMTLSTSQIAGMFRKECENWYGEGKDFIIDDQNRDVVNEMMRYFGRSEKFGSMVKNTPSLDKGVLISGGVGLGKSDLFSILHSVGRKLSIAGSNQMYFRMKSIRDLNEDDFEQWVSGNLYIDDVGTEDKVYGRELFSKLLQDRYIYAKRKPTKTFVTTNSRISEMAERYGIQVEDRLKEMFNIIIWTGDSRRK
jgi:DNA replication protein DnaC